MMPSMMKRKMPPPPDPEDKPKGMLAVSITAKPKGDEGMGGVGKESIESAGVVREDQHCRNCTNYDPSSGDCAKLEGQFAPEDACLRFFDASADEPDEDDQAGGAPDDDTDDSELGQSASGLTA